MISIPFTGRSDVSILDKSLGDTERLHDGSADCNIKIVISSYFLLMLSIHCKADR